MANKIGIKIANLRKEKNLSQMDLANKLNVSNKTISKWECGNATPDVDSLNALSKIFGVTIDELINDKTVEEQPIEQTDVEQITTNKSSKLGKRKILIASISSFIVFSLTLFLCCFFLIPRTPNVNSSDIFNIDQGTLVLSCKVDNNKDYLSLGNAINVPYTNSWNLYYDINGIQEIPSKTVQLQIGDNTFYIKVQNTSGTSKTYKVNIRRKPLYVVSFNTNGGSYIVSQTIQEDNMATYVEPTRDGYIFNGWDFDFSIPITRNITVNAKWVAENLSINYFANNGTDAVVNQSVVYDTTVQLKTDKEFIKQGYSLTSWNTKSDGSGTKYETSQKFNRYNITESINLYAQWTINKYKIIANKNLDGAGAITGTGSFEYASTNTLFAATNEGYTWIGWYTKDNVLVSKSQSLTITLSDVDVEYNALWKANEYTATLDVVDGNELTQNTQKVIFGEQCSLPITSKYEAQFLGWFTADDKQVSDALGNVSNWDIATDITLFAHYKINQYQLRLNKNIENAGIVSGGGLKDYNSTVNITAINNEGYSFVGWFNENTELTKSNIYEFSMPNHQLTYTAKWQANQYNVSLNVNGGNTLDQDTMTVVYNNAFSFPVPTKDGYQFSGWYAGLADTSAQLTDAEGNSLAAWNIAKDTEVVAKWELTTYLLSFELNDGTLTTENPSSYTIEDLDIRINNPIKQGYRFEGWIDKDNTTPTTELIISAGSFGDKKYGACWSRNDNFIAISSPTDLKNIANDLTANYYLTQDIDMTDIEFLTLGDEEHPFTGILDGNGYCIKNITFQRCFIYRLKGKVINLELYNAEVMGDSAITATLCSYNDGLIKNCKLNSKFLNGFWMCGITYQNLGEIRDCYFEGAIEKRGSDYDRHYKYFGIARANDGAIYNCYCNIEVILENKSNGYYNSEYGGFIEINSQKGIIQNCFMTGSITARHKGFAITNEGKILNCYILNSMDLSDENITAISDGKILDNEIQLFAEFVDINDLILNPNSVWVFDGVNYPKLYWEKD